ncbi:hypothetical protein NS184_12385 [Curtobacterium luteum]|uniref:Uracil-DNA glycosylase-like domain-containing protein n=1 Tax=Curtobacterium luteum TaxID=33881 RepID=A0A175RLL7_9MICO|nr:hypothetical protein NS184_12385 [Curtobacterium luteum]
MFDPFWAALDAVPVAPDAEALYDVGTAAGRLRRRNLATYLDTVGRAATMLLVAEAPGWRGMTNTGVPFTSTRELGPEYLVPPEPSAPWEASSRVVQAVLAEWTGPLPVAWAVFPHHPFAAPDRLTNRTPRPAEVRAGAPVAIALLGALRALRATGADSDEVDPCSGAGALAGAGAGAGADGAGAAAAGTGAAAAGVAGRDVRVVAVGRKAQGALALAGIDAVAVRHPAQGGAAQFTAEMRALRDA